MSHLFRPLRFRGANTNTLRNANAGDTLSIIVPSEGYLDINMCLSVVETAINSGLTSAPLIDISRQPVGTSTPQIVGLLARGATDGVLASDAVGRFYHFTPAWKPDKQYPGTVTITSGAATVTGVNTKFLTEYVYGDVFRTTGGQVRRVVSVASDTSLTVDSNWTTTETAVKYRNGQPSNLFGNNTEAIGSGIVRIQKGDTLITTLRVAGVGGTVAGAFAVDAALDLRGIAV